MSTAVMYEVRCDCRGCAGCSTHKCTVADFGTCGVAQGDYGTATQARARVRAAGWKVSRPGGTDYCWDCPVPEEPRTDA